MAENWFSDAAKSTLRGIADLHHLQPRPMPQLPGLRGCLGAALGGSKEAAGAFWGWEFFPFRDCIMGCNLLANTVMIYF